jgi:hypothetical protein
LRKLWRISLCERKEKKKSKNKIDGLHIIWDFFGRNWKLYLRFEV